MTVFDTLVERGFIATEQDGTPSGVTDPSIREILGQKEVTCYIGFDPSARSLHVGSLVQIMVLAHMQRAGHRPIFIVGGGTGLIGDPSGKTEMRQMLTAEQIADNMENFKKQAMRYVDFNDGRALLINNADWLTPVSYIEFLRDIGRHFSVNRMLTAESVKQRLETGLSFLEFNYMLLQAYDFLHLYQNYDCILQMGGADQWGNICAGIDLIRRVESGEGYGITFPLITTASGAKMGKTEKGAVWIDEELLSPYEYYQYWRNIDDRDVERFLGLYTFLPMDEVRRLGKLKDNKINEAKEVLAFEATKMSHGEEAALQAQKTARTLFEKGGVGKDIETVEIGENELREGILAPDLFHRLKLASSKGDARRLIKNGGAYIQREKITDIDLRVTLDHVEDGEILLRAGKKRYAKVVVK